MVAPSQYGPPFDGVGVAGNAHIDTVALERLPVLSPIRVSEVEIRWETVTTKAYQVQYRSNLTTNLWTDWGVLIDGNGTTNCVKDVVPSGEPRRFYRVVTGP